jgi:hypothetical protein
VRLQVRAIRAGREQVHRDIMRTVADHRKITQWCPQSFART